MACFFLFLMLMIKIMAQYLKFGLSFYNFVLRP